jgi:DNA-binding response OmpR family regulator
MNPMITRLASCCRVSPRLPVKRIARVRFMTANQKTGHTVLVADDYDGVRDFLTILFRSLGHRVVAVSDGDEALRLLREEAIDLAVIDLRLPRLGGLEVYRQARDEGIGVPTVFITGLPEAESEEVAAGWGIPYVLKPLRLDRFLSLVEALLPQKQEG